MKIITTLTQPQAISAYLAGVDLWPRTRHSSHLHGPPNRPNSNTRVNATFHLCPTGRSASSRCSFRLQTADLVACLRPGSERTETQRFKRIALGSPQFDQT